ncbi:GIY-YIG nuclease family protein [Bradyrhizobium tropiciagri]|uniref:GIY-YIG nuclease family protein n=1 Tax=Bradyrhizobium tropiciagri TaxID=312253 RepID=UPI001BAA036D|nr:GIY-YIG nuclease family protein [Bradyrhizobium tropiciagri]MBR0899459.1 GIY-YIG nuclease family protein [Bradyrhizobium tropiciagri]
MSTAGSYYVYILASQHHGTIYVGVTNDVRLRLELHRSGRGSRFVYKYQVFRLVHVEEFATPQEAIAREKQLKFWKRDWKIKLIEADNPDWNDRSDLIWQLG